MNRRARRAPGGGSAGARGHGQLRRSQVITTYGPGALIDLPRDSAIVGGLETWPRPSDLQEISEPRLSSKLRSMTAASAPRLHAPPPAPNAPWEPARGIGAWRFPEWFVVQEAAGGARDAGGDTPRRRRSRQLVHRTALDGGAGSTAVGWWPPASRPDVYYDPRALDADGPSGVFHAKAVVADEEAVFITSANLTEAAFDRNIETGLLLRDRTLAATVLAHFRGLIDRELLRPLPAA